MVTAKIEEIDRLSGWKLAQMIISASRTARGKSSARQNHFAPLQTAARIAATDAESPLIIDEGRFQASWRGKCLT